MIHEPMTLLTDGLLAAWSFLLGARLMRQDRHAERRLWAWGMLATGGAALLGGVWHGFSPFWGEELVVWSWRGVLLLIGTADLLFGLAVVRQSLDEPWRRRLVGCVSVKAGAYLTLLMFVDDFWLAILDYAPTLMLIAGLQIGRIHKAPESRWLVAGVGLAFFAAGVQAAGLGLHPRFNHNDLYHVIQGGALYWLYRGGRLFGHGADRISP